MAVYHRLFPCFEIHVLSAVALALALVSAPSDPAVNKGRQLFHSPGLGPNGVSCAHCHSIVEDEARDGDGLIRAGHTLWGVAHRPYWRGDGRRVAYPTLRRAVDVCVQLFQGGNPLSPDDSLRLAAFLESISPKRAQPPLVIKPALEANLDYDRDKYRGGDSDRGRALFLAACHSCHPHGGQGLGPSLFGKAPPEVALKVREGNGLLRGARIQGAWMAFYGSDRLSDPQVADLAAFVASLGPERSSRAEK